MWIYNSNRFGPHLILTRKLYYAYWADVSDMSAMGDGHNGLAAPQKTDSRLSRDQTCLAHSQFEHSLFNLLSSQHQCLCLTFHLVIPPNSTKFPSKKTIQWTIFTKRLYFLHKNVKQWTVHCSGAIHSTTFCHIMIAFTMQTIIRACKPMQMRFVL